MLDARPTSFIAPIDEQILDDILPIVDIQNLGDEPAQLSGHVSIYRQSLGTRLFTSVLHPGSITAGGTTQLSAESIFSPGAIADDDYFIMCTVDAINSNGNHKSHNNLGPYFFDIKPGPMGPAPAAHHATHEDGGLDEVSLAGLSGLLADPQTPRPHAASHGAGQADELDVTNLSGLLADQQTPLPHHATHEPGNPDRVLPVVVSEVSSATPTPDSDLCDLYDLSALAEAADFQPPNGNPTNGQKLIIRILDDGTARALTWGAGAGGYIARGAALPATTTISKYLYVGFIFNTTANRWDCVASAKET